MANLTWNELSTDEAISHVGLKLLIVNESGQFLTLHKKTGYTDLPGGRMQHGEDIFSAASRELQEETGLKLKSIISTVGSCILHDRIKVGDQRLALTLICFKAQTEEGPITLSDEHTSYTWIDATKLLENLDEKLWPRSLFMNGL